MVAGSLTWFSAVISSRKLPGASWIRQKLMTTTPRISGTAWTSRRRRSFRAASWRELACATAMLSGSTRQPYVVPARRQEVGIVGMVLHLGAGERDRFELEQRQERRLDRGDLLELDDQRLALGGIGLDLDLLDQGVDLVSMEARGVAEGHALLDAVGGEVLRGGRHRLRRIGLVGDREVEVVVGVDALDRGRPVGNGEVDDHADILQPLL